LDRWPAAISDSLIFGWISRENVRMFGRNSVDTLILYFGAEDTVAAASGRHRMVAGAVRCEALRW
jgi:hypothetical protein